MKNNIMIMRPSNKGLIDLIKYLPENCTMVEIGCYQGESTEIFLNSGKVKTLIAIDSWVNGYDKNDAASKRCDMKLVEQRFDERFKKDKRVIKLKLSSSQAIINVDNVDFVYIDALHTYEGVKSDILLYKSKTKLIGGHDYNDMWEGVKKAVDETLGKPDYIFEDSSWLKILE